MKIVSWNVNGIRAAIKKDLPLFLNEEMADIICLQEVKAWPEQLDENLISPRNFQADFSVAEKKGYSGVATFFPKNFMGKLVLKGFGNSKFDSEGRIICHEIGGHLIFNIYFPSGTTGEIRQEYKYDFLNYVFDYFESLDQETRNRSIICGDFNICHKEIDIHHPKQAEKLELSGFLPAERAWLDQFEQLGFADAFRLQHGTKPKSYTWWSYRAGARAKNLGWRIDYFWIGKNIEKRLLNCQILNEIQGSDHVPVLLELK